VTGGCSGAVVCAAVEDLLGKSCVFGIHMPFNRRNHHHPWILKSNKSGPYGIAFPVTEGLAAVAVFSFLFHFQ
jgi:hypothetical protein